MKMRFDPHRVRQILGRYRLTQRLGQGTMGVVFRAIDTRTRKPVAVKVLYQLFDANIVTRFRNEVRVMHTLKHPNIVRALSRTVKHCGGPFYYFPMELVQGPSLEAYLVRHPKLALHEAIPILRGVCAALAHAHANGVIHRDLKPGNILLTRDGQAKVSDFGLAKAAFADQQAGTFSVVGSRPYCSPRKWKDSSDARPATDLFSLGVIIYRMLTGEFPFIASSEGRLQELIEAGQYVSLSTARPDLPARIIELVHRLLDSDRNDWSGAKRVSEIMNHVYPTTRRSGLAVFPRWRRLRDKIRRLGNEPEWHVVRNVVRPRCQDLRCPDCGQRLAFDTYAHMKGRPVEIVFSCPCSEHRLDLD